VKYNLFIALDGLTTEPMTTIGMAEKLVSVDRPFGFKVNLDFFLFNGIPETIRILEHLGRPIFADLKMWNGTRTMVDVVAELALHVDYLNVHALADSQVTKAIAVAEAKAARVLGVTVLTHYDEEYCQKHFKRTLAATVHHLAITATGSGCHGIILPGTVLQFVNDIRTIKVVPGIRPTWFADKRHAQPVTPAQALKDGADVLVCGSPITKSDDPVGSLKRVLDEMQETT
jgi:orotidine-5'-phosphate decarboxylase